MQHQASQKPSFRKGWNLDVSRENAVSTLEDTEEFITRIEEVLK